MAFSDIPDRINGPAILAEWFNSLRAAGIALEAYLGTVTGRTAIAIVNNQSSPANITGLLFNGTKVKLAIVDYRIRRNTTGVGAQERVQAGTLLFTYKPTAATWTCTPLPAAGDDAGVTFSITNAGQVRYVSDNQTGTADDAILVYTVRTMA